MSKNLHSLKGGYIGDYIGNYYRGYYGGYSEFRQWFIWLHGAFGLVNLFGSGAAPEPEGPSRKRIPSSRREACELQSKLLKGGGMI